MENAIKMDENWGYPMFRKPPVNSWCFYAVKWRRWVVLVFFLRLFQRCWCWCCLMFMVANAWGGVGDRGSGRGGASHVQSSAFFDSPSWPSFPTCSWLYAVKERAFEDARDATAPGDNGITMDTPFTSRGWSSKRGPVEAGDVKIESRRKKTMDGYLGVSIVMGVPQNRWFIRENPI